MGIEAEFKQVSPYLLEKLKEHPDFVELFLNAKYLPDAEFWQDVTINLNYPNSVEWFDESTNSAAATLQTLTEERPEEFEKLKSDIPLIINEGKSGYFDLDKTWYKLHFLLTGFDGLTHPSFLIDENDEDRLPSINAIGGGTETPYNDGMGFVRYLTANEVEKVAKALSNFSHAMMTERLRFRGLREDNYYYLFEYKYDPFVRYYQDAAEKGKAMFLYLT